MTTVSCIIACYNAAATLRVAVDSALAQDGVDVEVIIVDDASKDNSRAIALAIAAADPRVRAIHNSVQLGPSATRNIAIAAAGGDWIAVLDADDYFAPGRLKALCDAALEADAQIVFDNQKIVSDIGSSLKLPSLAFDFPDKSIIDVRTFIDLSQTRPNQLSIGYAKPVFSRKFLDVRQLRYDEHYRVAEDWKILLSAIASGGTCIYVSRPFYFYVRNATSITLAGTNNYAVVREVMQSCKKEFHHQLSEMDILGISRLQSRLLRLSLKYEIRKRLRQLKALLLGHRKSLA